METLKKNIGAVLLLLLISIVPAGAKAAGEGGYRMRSVDIDLADRAALQRGAKYFINYCLSCHSASYMRYKRMATDLGLTDKEVEQDLMFATDKIGSTMTVAMPPAGAKKWFGAAPPDLSVRARARGTDWIYNYLLSFYLDSSRPTGVNNITFPNTAMPDVLWELQGLQEPEYEEVTDAAGNKHRVIQDLKLAHKGEMNPAEYRRTVKDIVTFLAYVGEPAQLIRYNVGIWVLLFLALFFAVSYGLYKEYWKDVH